MFASHSPPGPTPPISFTSSTTTSPSLHGRPTRLPASQPWDQPQRAMPRLQRPWRPLSPPNLRSKSIPRPFNLKTSRSPNLTGRTRNRTGDKRGRHVGTFGHTPLAFSVVGSPSGPDSAAGDAGQSAGVVHRRGPACAGARPGCGIFLGSRAARSDAALCRAPDRLDGRSIVGWPARALGGRFSRRLCADRPPARDLCRFGGCRSAPGLCRRDAHRRCDSLCSGDDDLPAFGALAAASAGKRHHRGVLPIDRIIDGLGSQEDRRSDAGGRMKRLRRRSSPKVAKDKGRYASFTRRTLLLSGGMTAVFGVLAGRLYQLQIVDGDSYLSQAEDNRISLRLLAPPRGRIHDRFGVPLAGSRRNYRVLVVPEQTQGGVAAAYDALAKVIPLNERVRGRVLKDAAARKSFMPVLIADNLSWDDFARLNLELPYLPGVQPDVGETRDYPYAEELSHVLGYVAAVSPEDKERDTSGDP